MKLAIIPARGGSKRIPKKNIKNFRGRPIIEYSIHAALDSGLFDRVTVSTDSDEIASVAMASGAEVPFYRSEKNSSDFATTSDVLEEVLNKYGQMGEKCDIFCCIYPTAPFVTPYKLCQAYEMLDKMNADSVLPIVRYSYPPQRGIIVHDGFAKFQYIENRYARSQDLDPIFHDAGQFYFLRTLPFLEQHDLVLRRTVPYYLDELEVQDIDNETDWKLAEIKYGMMVDGNEC